MDLKHEKCSALFGLVKPFSALFSCFVKGGVFLKTRNFVFLCRTQAQEMVNIELQARKQEFYDKRILSYWTRIFDSQVQQGQDFSK